MSEGFAARNYNYGVMTETEEDTGNTFTFTTGMAQTETDISALFTDKDLTGTKRRQYAVWLDLNAVLADGNTPDVTIRAKYKVDGSTYRQFDHAHILNAGEEKCVVIVLPWGCEDFQITMQLSATLASNRSVPYDVIEELGER